MDEKELQTEIAKKLRQLRESSGLSMHQLGVKCGISAQRVNDLEHGKLVPKLATLMKIADGLEISVFDILDEPLGRNYDAEVYNPNFVKPCENAKICPFFKPERDREK